MTALPSSARLLDAWRQGTMAELAVVPVSTVTPVPASLDSVASSRLSAVTRCLVPYGGLRRARLRAGEAVIVNGATGDFGGAAVHVARAMGAARIVAAGRNKTALGALGRLDRVVPVRLTGDVDGDAAALRDAAGCGADCALDLVGNAADTAATQATLAALDRGGRLVLMGSATAPLTIDYTQLMLSNREIIGNFMYPASVPAEVLQLVAAGLLDLAAFEIAEFPLDELPAAMDAAARPGGRLVVLTTAAYP